MKRAKLRLNMILLIIFSLLFSTSIGYADVSVGKTIITIAVLDKDNIELAWTEAENATGYDLTLNDGLNEFSERTKDVNMIIYGVDESHKYTIKVRPYKKYYQKVKKYYNKKTKKYQLKKPAKKYLGKSKYFKVSKYAYAEVSSVTLTGTNYKEQDADPSTEAVDPKLEAIRNEMLLSINKERTNKGLNSLVLNDTINSTAQEKAIDMYNSGVNKHESPNIGVFMDQLDKLGYKYLAAGENIAWGQTSVSEVMDDWMNSQGHRDNILRKEYNKVGIGYYNGKWVQQFTN